MPGTQDQYPVTVAAMNLAGTAAAAQSNDEDTTTQ
jgi:hypothetical protein